MATNTLYVFAVSPDHHIAYEPLLGRIAMFITSRSWRCPDVRSIAQKEDDNSSTVGIEIDLPDPHDEPHGWFADIAVIVLFCAEIRREFQVDFVVGMRDNRTGCGEDIVEIASDHPDLDYLRRFLGGGSAVAEGS